MDIPFIASLIATFLLVGLVLFQIALIMGKPFGRYAWGGQHERLPKKLRIGSAVSIVLYIVFAVFILSKSGVIDGVVQEPIVTTGMWIITGYMCVGVLVNLVSRSKPERKVMTPVAAILAVCFLTVTLLTSNFS